MYFREFSLKTNYIHFQNIDKVLRFKNNPNQSIREIDNGV